jgi:transposase
MDYISIDLHKTSGQVCILTEDGELIEHRFKTARERFDNLFADKSQARILVEASTESEWCARHRESPGHEVLVADPNFVSMHATRGHRIKTDKRNARALCEACRLGTTQRIKRLASASSKHTQASAVISLARACLRRVFRTQSRRITILRTDSLGC